MNKKSIIIIGIIMFSVSLLFVSVIGLNIGTSVSNVQVSGKIIHNPDFMPHSIAFNSHVGTTNVTIDSDSYSVTLPNDQTYSVDVLYEYKNTTNISPNEAYCNAGTFDLHTLTNQIEYNITCPKTD